MFAQDVVRIVIYEINLRARLDSRPRRADHKGGFAAFGDGKHHIPGRHRQITHLFFAKIRVILESFNRFNQGKIPAGHHAHGAHFPGAVPPFAEITPDGIQQYAQPPGGTAAGEENAPVLLNRVPHHGGNRFRTAGLHELPKGGQHVAVGLKQQLERRSRILPGRFAQIGGHGMR